MPNSDSGPGLIGTMIVAAGEALNMPMLHSDSSPVSFFQGAVPALVSRLTDSKPTTLSPATGSSCRSAQTLLGRQQANFAIDANVEFRAGIIGEIETILRSVTLSLDLLTRSNGSVSNGAGVNQCARSNAAFGAKKIENCPPSGPSHKRSSPPKALMCSRTSPDAMSSRLIQP